MSTPRPPPRGDRPPRGSRKVAKPHFLESTPRPTPYVVRPPRGMSKVAKPHLLMSRNTLIRCQPGARRDPLSWVFHPDESRDPPVDPGVRRDDALDGATP